jgi:hypothetical protein
VAGFIDLLLAEWTDHRTGLSGDGVYSANSGAGSEFPCVTSQFYSKDRCQRTHCRWNLAFEAPSITPDALCAWSLSITVIKKPRYLLLIS